MTKAEAAALLGISERQVTNYASSGRLGVVRYVKGKTRDIADFEPEAVQALKTELEAVRTMTRTPTESTALERNSALVPDDGAANGETATERAAITTHRQRALMKSDGANREIGNLETTNREAEFSSSQFLVLPIEAIESLVTRFERIEEAIHLIGQGSATEASSAALQAIAVKPLLSASEINALYGVPEREVRAAMKDGSLPSGKIGRSQRARRGDVDMWLNRRFEG